MSQHEFDTLSSENIALVDLKVIEWKPLVQKLLKTVVGYFFASGDRYFNESKDGETDESSEHVSSFLSTESMSSVLSASMDGKEEDEKMEYSKSVATPEAAEQNVHCQTVKVNDDDEFDQDSLTLRSRKHQTFVLVGSTDSVREESDLCENDCFQLVTLDKPDTPNNQLEFSFYLNGPEKNRVELGIAEFPSSHKLQWWLTNVEDCKRHVIYTGFPPNVSQHDTGDYPDEIYPYDSISQNSDAGEQDEEDDGDPNGISFDDMLKKYTESTRLQREADVARGWEVVEVKDPEWWTSDGPFVNLGGLKEGMDEHQEIPEDASKFLDPNFEESQPCLCMNNWYLDVLDVVRPDDISRPASPAPTRSEKSDLPRPPHFSEPQTTDFFRRSLHRAEKVAENPDKPAHEWNWITVKGGRGYGRPRFEVLETIEEVEEGVSVGKEN